MKTEREWKEEVLKRLQTLAQRKVNDAVKLAFLKDEELDQLGGLDLTSLSELKRHGNGAVEIKLVDKLSALEKLYEMAGRSGETAEQFFRVLDTHAKGEG